MSYAKDLNSYLAKFGLELVEAEFGTAVYRLG